MESNIKYAYVAVTNDLNQDQRMHRICNSLSKLGFAVVLIGRQKPDSAPLLPQSFKQKRLRLIFSKGILFYLEYQIRLFLYLLVAAKPSVVYSVDLDTALPVCVIGWLRKSTRIHDAHELFTEVPELNHSPIKRNIWTAVGKATVSKFDHRLTVNDSLATILGKKYRCDFNVIKNLPVEKKLKLDSSIMSKQYIWYQGVLNHGRGLEQMIAAMDAMPSLELRIAGEGDLSDALRVQAQNSTSRSRIHFHGWLSSDEMHTWASNAYIGINLLDAASGNYYYSSANKGYDYIQAELPAIHMAFPEYQILNQEHDVALLIENLEVTDIVKAVKHLQDHPATYLQLKAACRKAKSILNWREEEKKLLHIFK